MKHWQSYVRASWQLVVEAQGTTKTYLEPDVETFLVHVMARSFERTDFWSVPIAIKMLEAKSLPVNAKKPVLRSVGEECLFIDAWEFKKPRWPDNTYFKQMGSIAFGMASVATRPPDELLDIASLQFDTMSQVLRGVRDLYLSKN